MVCGVLFALTFFISAQPLLFQTLPAYPREKNLVRDVFGKSLSDFYSQNNSGVPNFVRKEVSDFLKCGVLAHGFVKLYCKGCRTYDVLAFSCKRRGFCPSCLARRMNDTAIHLDENVFPEKPIRQWVLSFPFFIRYLMAYDPEISTKILRIYQKEVSKFYENRTKAVFQVKSARTGAVTVIQRFGGALNINPHFHSLFIEGTYYKKHGELRFHRGKAPLQKDLEKLLKIIIKKVIRYLTKISYTEGEQPGSGLKENELSSIYGQSVVYRIAVGKRKGEKVQLVGYEIGEPRRNSSGGVSLHGFNIHAGVCIHEKKRKKLLTLCRYISRGPIAKQRFERINDDKIAIRFKRAWSNGATHVVYTNVEFIEKLVALIPPPRANLVRYFGVFAPRNKWRKEIVPVPKVIDGFEQERVYRVSWAELLKRTFGIDGEKWKSCGGRVEAVSIVLDPRLIDEILGNLGISSKRVYLSEVSYRGPPSSEKSNFYEEEYSQAPNDW